MKRTSLGSAADEITILFEHTWEVLIVTTGCVGTILDAIRCFLVSGSVYCQCLRVCEIQCSNRSAA